MPSWLVLPDVVANSGMAAGCGIAGLLVYIVLMTTALRADETRRWGEQQAERLAAWSARHPGLAALRHIWWLLWWLVGHMTMVFGTIGLGAVGLLVLLAQGQVAGLAYLGAAAVVSFVAFKLVCLADIKLYDPDRH